MQLIHALTALMAIGASAAPYAEADTGVQDIDARNYQCGRNSYWKNDCCQCKIEGQVHNKHWGGCDYPNKKVDKEHGCKGNSYYDYHRNCCACSQTNNFYFAKEEKCEPCGPNAYYDYESNQCKCKVKHEHFSPEKKCCLKY